MQSCVFGIFQSTKCLSASLKLVAILLLILLHPNPPAKPFFRLVEHIRFMFGSKSAQNQGFFIQKNHDFGIKSPWSPVINLDPWFSLSSVS